MKRHYLELWALLAVAFVIFAVASAFDTPMAKSDFADMFFPRSSAADTVAVAIEEPLVVNSCDTTNQTILFIGDSMLEGLSPRLAAYAAHNRHTLYSVIWYSSTTGVWGQSDKLRNYVAQIKPTYVFVCLGANELFVKNPEKRKDDIDSILAQIGDIPYLWIGPPNWAEDTGINDLIASSTASGTFFKSKGMNFERSSDGAHPTAASASVWLDSIVRWMPANARHNIRLDVPQQLSARPHRTFVHQPSER